MLQQRFTARIFSPNCGGDFTSRPHRPANKLEKYPASIKRIYKPGGCEKAA